MSFSVQINPTLKLHETDMFAYITHARRSLASLPFPMSTPRLIDASQGRLAQVPHRGAPLWSPCRVSHPQARSTAFAPSSGRCLAASARSSPQDARIAHKQPAECAAARLRVQGMEFGRAVCVRHGAWPCRSCLGVSSVAAPARRSDAQTHPDRAPEPGGDGGRGTLALKHASRAGDVGLISSWLVCSGGVCRAAARM